MRSPRSLVFALGSLLGACATAARPSEAPAPSSAEVAPPAREGGTVERLPHAPRVGRYVSSKWGFSTVSYWIEGPEGVVVIDTQFLPSAAAELVERRRGDG